MSLPPLCCPQAVFSLRATPDQSHAGPAWKRFAYCYKPFWQTGQGRGCKCECPHVYPLDHGFCPVRRPVLCSSLKDTSQDVDDNVTAEQTHDVGEIWAEGRGHRGTKSWEQKTNRGNVRGADSLSSGEDLVERGLSRGKLLITFIIALLSPPLLLWLFCLQ